ncbi:MAG: flagellar basal-body rod protein FlgG [Candidatus Marinimicrobia bacterium]|nr:flagellar basal-body rod protein FlgG [Candidatus Neomarinimicrobiota bacterium]
MIRSLRTAALGMGAQQLQLDVIANNLANVNTTGFKRSSVEFQDVLYETIVSGAGEGGPGQEKPSEIQVGHGNRAVSTFRTFAQGAVEQTENPLDLAIDGDGFFQVLRPDGSYAYSRDGSFRISSDGYIVSASGLRLGSEISLPAETGSVNISQDGIVSVLLSGEIEPSEIGQLELAKFVNPAGLLAIGGNLYEETVASGPPSLGFPSDEGFGVTLQGFLEKSNVDVVQEMINMIVAQRAYEINSKAVKSADEMLAVANNIRR